MQPGKVRTAVGVTGHNLAVEHGNFGWELVQQLGDGRKALGEIMPIAASTARVAFGEAGSPPLCHDLIDV